MTKHILRSYICLQRDFDVIGVSLTLCMYALCSKKRVLQSIVDKDSDIFVSLLNSIVISDDKYRSTYDSLLDML